MEERNQLQSITLDRPIMMRAKKWEARCIEFTGVPPYFTVTMMAEYLKDTDIIEAIEILRVEKRALIRYLDRVGPDILIGRYSREGILLEPENTSETFHLFPKQHTIAPMEVDLATVVFSGATRVIRMRGWTRLDLEKILDNRSKVNYRNERTSYRRMLYGIAEIWAMADDVDHVDWVCEASSKENIARITFCGIKEAVDCRSGLATADLKGVIIDFGRDPYVTPLLYLRPIK